MYPDDPLPEPREQRIKDLEHLKLLAIFHFVLAGLLFMGIAFLGAHFLLMNTVFSDPNIWKNTPNPPPVQFFSVIKYFYAFMGGCLVLAAVGNLLCGLYLRARKNRIFSLVVAGLNCLQFPFGTALGVFTLVVLLRPSICELYEAGPAGAVSRP